MQLADRVPAVNRWALRPGDGTLANEAGSEDVMAKPMTHTPRTERREARRVVAEAQRAEKEARKLAKMLSLEARANFEAKTAGAHRGLLAARSDLRVRPRRAKRMARKATAQLERASIVATESGDIRRRALAEADAKKRAKTIKRRLAQAKQANKMAKFVALHTVVASVATPTDDELAKKRVKQVRRSASKAF